MRKDGKMQVALYMTEEEYTELKAFCDKKGVKYNSFINIAIKELLEREKNS